MYPELLKMGFNLCIHSSAPPTLRPNGVAVDLPFLSSQSEAILVLDLSRRNTFSTNFAWSSSQSSSYLFIRRSHIMSFLEGTETTEGPREIPWNVWGPRGTRFLWTPEHYDRCVVYGTRCIISSNLSPGDSASGLRIYDFSPSVFRHQEGRRSSGIDRRLVLNEATVKSAAHGIFMEDIVTSLPYYCTSTRAMGTYVLAVTEDGFVMFGWMQWSLKGGYSVCTISSTDRRAEASP